ncbi:CASP-like protein 1E2 [Humulus lupulus]|uniref:CASP-like protein 1E2 n=1 Tax=Humulus lupulus TaxID=3486 RepID=UPI002B40D6B1|nr:CASP-like protein 1E2 [Humulus lupulus]
MEKVEGSEKRGGGGCGGGSVVVRIMAFALTVSAAVILGVDKQTKSVAVTLLDSLPPLTIPVTAKWHYLSAFTYFVVANAIASSYALISLIFSLANHSGKKSGNLGFLMAVFDMMMVALLFSSNGAAAAIGLMGMQGNSHVQWKKVCNVFNKFCHQGAAAVVLSLLGANAFLLLAILAIKRLPRK